MLSYKEYKLLNESLYGAFNLGLRNPATVGGIISGSSVNGTEAALEAESEATLEESKKKKKMDCGDEEKEEDMEDKEAKGSDEEEGDEESEEEGDEDEEEGEEEEEEKEEPKFMKKKAKKEWTEVMADLESVLEDVSDDVAMEEIKRGLGLIKEGIKKGKCGPDCKCKKCKDKDKNKGLKGDQNKLDVDGDGKITKKDFQIMNMRSKGEKKEEGEKEDKKCGRYMKKGCGSKYMNEDEQAWWSSVNSMVNANPEQKSWDGWSEIGEVQQAVREGSEVNEGNADMAAPMSGNWSSMDAKSPSRSPKNGDRMYSMYRGNKFVGIFHSDGAGSGKEAKVSEKHMGSWYPDHLKEAVGIYTPGYLMFPPISGIQNPFKDYAFGHLSVGYEGPIVWDDKEGMFYAPADSD